MGLSSLRRHRGGYIDRQLVQREPTREDLAAALEAEKAKTAALQAALEAQAKATEATEPAPPLEDVESDRGAVIDEDPQPEPAPEPTKPSRAKR